MKMIVNFINELDGLVWGWPMIILLLGTHIVMTVCTGGIQRKIGTAIKLSVTKDTEAEGEVSQFGALATALASTIGTGNIIGVGTAIYLGGPAYPFYALVYVHLLIMLGPAALRGGDSAVASVVVYTAVFGLYAVLRVARAIRERHEPSEAENEAAPAVGAA